ncbi:hypothetical protein [Ectobacillus funiculus]|uniref:Uncharacterized protein n=1 Tax=Ectobacillus funiculus TaxID=137993 RepID=A0ABV5WD56_9BACI
MGDVSRYRVALSLAAVVSAAVVSAAVVHAVVVSAAVVQAIVVHVVVVSAAVVQAIVVHVVVVSPAVVHAVAVFASVSSKQAKEGEGNESAPAYKKVDYVESTFLRFSAEELKNVHHSRSLPPHGGPGCKEAAHSRFCAGKR